MSENKEFNQTEFNAAMLTAMDKMGKAVCLMHYALLDNKEYAKEIGEQTELLTWYADINRCWRTELLKHHRKDFNADTIDILEKIG